MASRWLTTLQALALPAASSLAASRCLQRQNWRALCGDHERVWNPARSHRNSTGPNPLLSTLSVDGDLHYPVVTQTRRGSLNHSCEPNLWMDDETVVADHRIVCKGSRETIGNLLGCGTGTEAIFPAYQRPHRANEVVCEYRCGLSGSCAVANIGAESSPRCSKRALNPTPGLPRVRRIPLTYKEFRSAPGRIRTSDSRFRKAGRGVAPVCSDLQIPHT